MATCSDCSEGGGGLLPLRCKQHRICEGCLLLKARRGEDAQKCAICESQSAEPLPAGERPEPGIWIYVDDSNIWIEAKKLASKTKKFKTDQDHRVRIDVGKLTEVVANGRRVEQGFLYGSVPPPVDTVWEKIKNHGWKVDTKERSRISGKEKKVDTALVADVTEKAITTPVEQRSTIILITGDADVIPAIEKAREYRGWSVEVYMWEHALSAELKSLGHSKESSVSTFALDSCLDKITFTNMRFNLRKNQHLRPIVEKSGIVFSMKPGVFQQAPTRKWCRQVESIAQWPFQYYWLEDHDQEPTDELVLVFRDSDGREFDMKQFMDTLKENPLPSVDSIQTYSQRMRSGSLETVLGVGPYSLNDVLETSDRDDYDEKSEWTLVEPRRKSKQHYLPSSELCSYGFNCKYGLQCWSKHTKKENDFFRASEGRGNPVWKVKPCSFFPGCKKREDCPYAHGEDDAWCLICRKRGHFTDKCQANE